MVSNSALHVVKSRLYRRDIYAHEVGALCVDVWDSAPAIGVSSFDVPNGNRVGLRLVDKSGVHGRGAGPDTQTTRPL